MSATLSNRAPVREVFAHYTARKSTLLSISTHSLRKTRIYAAACMAAERDYAPRHMNV